MAKKIITGLILVMSAWLYVAAQTVVEGRVTSATDGSAIEFATVAVPGSTPQLSTLTDHRGRYSLTVPKTDSVSIAAAMTGYATTTQTVTTRGMKLVIVNFELKQQATQLDEVQVNDRRNSATVFTTIEAEKLEASVGPASGVESLIKTLPDVASNNEMSSQYSVRGGSFDENLVYINGVEVYRPMLIRSGQQEGMSIINPDLVTNISFSPGGFDVSYGDRMSSVLDITYSRPTHFSAKLSGSLLGGSASVQGTAGSRWSYSVGLRRHSNQYIISTLDTKGDYTTAYTDLQAIASYRINDRLSLSLVAIGTYNVYGLVPESRTTTFKPMAIDIYFDGQELDRYRTLLGSASLDYRPNDDWQLRLTLSAQNNNESERYDIQSQYFLYMIGTGGSEGDSIIKFDRGVGTFLDHARNSLSSQIYAAELRATRFTSLGSWKAGLKLQGELIDDRLREWLWIDSAGYTYPGRWDTPGDSANMPYAPVLHDFASAVNATRTLRTSGYLLRELNFTTRRGGDLRLTAGIRAQHYAAAYATLDSTGSHQQFLFSPRLGMGYTPAHHRDMTFSAAAGVYQQPAFYREARRPDGSLNMALDAQTSYQAVGTFDWVLRIWDRPFRLTTDVYYKYLDNVVPYTIDNLRIRYMAENSAVGYAAGLSVRLNGELIDGLESWASLSLMRTQEDIEGDGYGWIDRPTDQRFSFKLFLQDNIPQLPWWRMSLNLVYATGLPYTYPGQQDPTEHNRFRPYFRIDWGNTLQLSRFDLLRRLRLFNYVSDVQLGVEVFNLFNYRNVASYIWAADYTNQFWGVPNYLTGRQINVKLTVIL
ncbi:MAG: TonB-dependent receptor [Bacteroidales bacterium]|nr:TonB-dependent receptor [Bacteroidales bacterium]